MRDICRFWIRAGVKCETVVVILESCKRKKRDCRRFLCRAPAKCETFVGFGVVQAGSARPSSLLQGYGRDPRNVGGF